MSAPAVSPASLPLSDEITAQLDTIKANPASIVDQLTFDVQNEILGYAIDRNDLESVRILSKSLRLLTTANLDTREGILERAAFGDCWSILYTAFDGRAVIASNPSHWLEISYGAPITIFIEILQIVEERLTVGQKIQWFERLLDAQSNDPLHVKAVRAALERANIAAVARMATTVTSLPRDCIYSILPFLTLREIGCTTALLSHEWYTATQSLRSLGHSVAPGLKGLTTLATHLLMSSLLRHHVAHLSSKMWRADQSLTRRLVRRPTAATAAASDENADNINQIQNEDEDEDEDGFYTEMADETTIETRWVKRLPTGVRNLTRSIHQPLAQIAKSLSHLISLTFECIVREFIIESHHIVVPINTIIVPSLPRIFSPQLRSLKLELKFDEFEYSPRTWKYVEHLFELISQQLSHSLIIFHCTINETSSEVESEDDSDEAEESIEAKRARIFSADILRHLIPMKELRTLMLHYPWFKLSESAIDCLRAIPQLTELDGQVLASQVYQACPAYLIREPSPQFTRLGGTQGYPCGCPIDFDRDEAELSVVLPALGRMLTHAKLVIAKLPQTSLLMHFTAVKFMEIFLASDNLDVDSLVQAFSKSTQLERLSLVFSKTIVGLPDGLIRIFSGLLKLTHLHLHCYNSVLRDLTFLCSVPHLIDQLLVLSLPTERQSWSLDAYRLIYSFTQLTRLHISDKKYKKELDTMFRPASQWTCSYHPSEGEVDPLPSGPGQLPAGHLPHLTYFSQSFYMHIQPLQYEHEMEILREANETRSKEVFIQTK